MIIKWFGLNCIQIKSQNRIVVIDPFSDKSGLKMPSLRADIVAATNEDAKENLNQVKKRKKSELFVIDGAGEYEVKQVLVKGIYTKNDQLIYNIYSEGISFAHLGPIKQKELTNQQLEDLNNVDILAVPVGNKDAIDYQKAVDIIQQIEPRMVIPIYYQTKGLNKDLDKIDKFLKEEGIKDLTPEEELKISKGKLPSEKTEIVQLKP